jgi:hypothetical protein
MSRYRIDHGFIAGMTLVGVALLILNALKAFGAAA